MTYGFLIGCCTGTLWFSDRCLHRHPVEFGQGGHIGTLSFLDRVYIGTLSKMDRSPMLLERYPIRILWGGLKEQVSEKSRFGMADQKRFSVEFVMEM